MSARLTWAECEALPNSVWPSSRPDVIDWAETILTAREARILAALDDPALREKVARQVTRQNGAPLNPWLLAEDALAAVREHLTGGAS